MRVIMVLLATCAVMLALIVNLLLKPKSASRLGVWFACMANVLGFLLYGYGYAVLEKNILIAILKTVYAVFGMFLGKDSMTDMKALPFFELSWVKLLMYLAQMMALYITASAAISAFGAGLMNRLRAFTFRFGPLNMIYGLSAETLTIGKELADAGEKICFIAEKAEEKDRQEIRRMKGVLFSDPAALAGSVKFLKRLSIKDRPRKFTIYAIGPSPAANIHFAENIRKSLQESGTPSSMIRLILCMDGDFDASLLQQTGDQYGFGSVISFERPYLAARVLLKAVPPYETMHFQENGDAEGDFDAVIIGFGDVGQEILKGLAQNAQFPGSHFHATVFDANIHNIDGSFRYRYKGLLDALDIELKEGDGRSSAVFDYIIAHADSLEYIAIATGSASMNEKIAREISVLLRDLSSSAMLTECTETEVIQVLYQEERMATKRWPLYTRELISTETLDEMAMILNQYYCAGNGKSKEENWAVCDYFSRRSCRAATDFIPAFLKMVGRTEEEVLKSGWQLDQEMLTRLGRAEHERWCAFHYANGYQPMSLEEWKKRASAWAETHVHIGKDPVLRHHACLIPWEDLGELGEREAKVTGKPVDYYQMDIDNILAIPELLRQKQR